MATHTQSFLERLAASKKAQHDAGFVEHGTRPEIHNHSMHEEAVSPSPSFEEEFSAMEAEMAADPATSGDGGDAQEGQLALDVYQTEDTIVIKSTIAGVSAEDLDVSLSNDMVTVRGIRRDCDVVNADRYFYQECYWGPFSRSVILPVEVDAESAVASIKNGIMTISLPKMKKDIAHKITVTEG